MSKSKNSKTGRCSAVTNSGKRCKRSSIKLSQYCQQHSDMLDKCLWGCKSGLLESVPEAPPTLSQMAAGYWRQYCQELLDHQKLKGSYLRELFELCWRHDYREELGDLIKEYGLVNFYEKGPQLVGLDKILDRNDKRITDLKKQFGLTLDTESKLSGGTKQKENPKNTPMRKIKKSW